MNSYDWKEVDEYLHVNIPGWVVYSIDDYCDDYGWLKKNWQAMCEKFNVRPQKIIIVKRLNFNNATGEDFIINQLSSTLTTKGYVVRREGEFTLCKVCEKAIPCKEIYDLMKELGAPVPKCWSNKCTTC